MSEELKPCPFCGGTNLSIETNSVQPDDFHDGHVVCDDCDASGRHAMTLEGWLSSKDEAKAEAAIAWNRRAAPAAAQLDAELPPLTNTRIIEIADTTRTAESRDGDYILPISFARAIEVEIVAQYAERIRLLERELATFKAEHATLQPDAWVYECRQPLTDPVVWAEFFGRDKPSSSAWIRNVRGLAYIDGRTAGTASDAWISVADRLPEVGELVLVYSPPTKYDHPGEVNITFDCIDPDADEPSWLNHNEHYEHFCCVAKPEGSVGPSADAPYTHWKRVAAPSPQENTNG